jgi:SNF2 family DNA or RNA helicase
VSLAIEKQELENRYDKDDPRRRVDVDNLKHVARFWGGNRDTREDEERRFLNDPQCQYMVATAAAGGRGRTWTVADLVVYYSNTADLEHRSQSEERAQGVDKVNSVLYVDLIAPGTVDEKMLSTLRRKINMAAAITSDTWREWVI